MMIAEQQKVVLAQKLEQELGAAIEECKPDRRFVLVDENTQRLCWPLVQHFSCLQGAQLITIEAGDEHKTLQSLSHVWSSLQRMGATRHSLMVNLGGGMVTDLGGFAASTFKRGIAYINIPTTLLSMVDASVGGKTGINFGGLKNEIGVFQNAHTVFLDTVFLRTMDKENMLSGYAEMLKHGLINTTAMWAQLLQVEIGAWERQDAQNELLTALSTLVAESVAVKQRIVTEDPTERGLRKALNLGHTMGHAFESLALQRHPVLHGYAVAWGLIGELYLSVVKTGFPVDRMRQTVRFIAEHYGRMAITCDDYPALIELMTHDKKNEGDSINFTLLGDIGDIRINQTATRKEIEEALDFYRESN